MHEMSLLKDLLAKITSIAKERGVEQIISVKIKIGALAHISGEHFREHWQHAIPGHAAENAVLEIIEEHDENAPDAQEIVLVSIKVPES